MLVTEIFHSIQGEGKLVGTPSVFVRLFGCNLACTWCDSKYSWQTKGNEVKQMTPEQVAKEISKHMSTNIVWTGGEPTLQQAEIWHVIQELGTGYHHTVETNGSQVITTPFDLVVISPKLENSGNKSYPLKANKNSLEKIFKFVVSSEQDFQEIEEYIQANNIIDSVYLMPEGVTSQKQIEMGQRIVEFCLQTGFIFCPRIHTLLWGNTRAK